MDVNSIDLGLETNTFHFDVMFEILFSGMSTTMSPSLLQPLESCIVSVSTSLSSFFEGNSGGLANKDLPIPFSSLLKFLEVTSFIHLSYPPILLRYLRNR
ncbi:hypothetical protein Droror1_Dr00002703 [Drosera rotundifolia]